MKYTEDYTNGAYIYKEDVSKFIEEHKDSTIDELYKCIVDCSNNIKRDREIRSKCTSDYSYWSFIQSEETYKACKTYCEDRILQMLESTGSVTLTKLSNDSDNYNRILNHIQEETINLTKYRPTGYKRMIELLTDLTKEES